jgi:hypothetical protein
MGEFSLSEGADAGTIGSGKQSTQAPFGEL